jgi:hypothetical protein
MAKKQHDIPLTKLIANMRDLPDRMLPFVLLIGDVRELIEAVKTNSPAAKRIAEMIENGNLKRAQEAFGDEQS